ncbi:MAG: transglutaminase family protein [Gammaproteobacteria bacterium]|nr:transglutaminase family protein [Gammaproteobacteria bacterium]
MRLKIHHQTSYDYDAPVQYGLQQLRLRPKSGHGQQIISWNLAVEGGRVELDFEDQHHNHVDLVGIDPGHHQVRIVCEGEVETADNAGVIGQHKGFAPLWLFRQSTPLTRPGPQSRRLVKQLGGEFDSEISRLHALSNLVLESVSYEVDRTHAQTTAEEALAAGHGVCQDHAHVFVTAARLLGYPARYVSGYLMMTDRVEQDASHAWAEACLDEIGWIGFDVANGISPDERYVRIATGLDYRDAAPISGLRYGDSDESMLVSVQVEQ